MIIEPMGSRILIRPLQQESGTSCGIILPETAKEEPQLGMIEAVGDEEQMITGLEVGDKVMFPKYPGSEISMDGVDYLIMDEGDVLARLSE